MEYPARITERLLDILEMLIEATRQSQELHGWAFMKWANRSGPCNLVSGEHTAENYSATYSASEPVRRCCYSGDNLVGGCGG